jgi:hypothetical protein
MSANLNAPSVIWTASSVSTVHVPIKRELEYVRCGMLKNFKANFKKRKVKKIYVWSNMSLLSLPGI